MPFFRNVKETPPGFHPELPWPINGLAYVIMFMGPFPGSLGLGMAIPLHPLHKIAAAFVGALIGAAVTAGNGVLFDYLVEPWIAKYQAKLQSIPVRVVTKTLGFAWAIGTAALAISMTEAFILWAYFPWNE